MATAIVLMQLGLLSTSCQSAPSEKTLDDPEIKALLRPAEPIEQETFVLEKDGRLHYRARLKEEPKADYVERYLGELEERGFSFEAEGTSPHAPFPRATGYSVSVVQEASLQPYTIRYKVASESEPFQEDAGSTPARDYPHPVALKGTQLSVRLGSDFLRPWKEAIVVPEHSTASLPFAVPLPAATVVVRVSERRDQVFAEGKFTPSSTPTGFIIAVISRRPPAEVLGFYRDAVLGWGTLLRNDSDRFSVEFAASLPPWAPAGLETLTVEADNVLLSTGEGVTVSDARHARFRSPGARPGFYQRKTLKNLPPDAFPYRIGITLRSQKALH